MSDQTELKPLLKTDVSAKMTEVIESSEPHVLTIEELNLSIKQTLEGQFGLIWVRGEISNFKAHTSRHF